VRPASISSISLVDPGTGHVDLEAKAEKDDVEEIVGFHAVAPTAWIVHDLGEKMLRFDIDGAVPRIMLGEIFPWHLAQVMFLEKIEKG